MERLSKRMSGISYCMCGNVIISKCENCTNRLPSCYEEDCTAQVEVLSKLAEYEDTNLTPAEVTALQQENAALKAERDELKKTLDDKCKFCQAKALYKEATGHAE